MRWFNDAGYYDRCGHYVWPRTSLPARWAHHTGVYFELHPFQFWLLLVFAVWLTGFVVTGTVWGGVRAVGYALGESLRPFGETP